MDAPRASMLSSWELRLIESIHRQAERDADILCDALDAAGVKGEITLTEALDRAAELRMESWDKSGLMQTVRPYLSKYEAPVSQHVKKGSTGVCSVKHLVYFVVWVMCFAWSGPQTVGADVATVGGSVLEEAQIDQLARILWRAHRIRSASKQ